MNLGQRIRSGVKWLALGNMGSQIMQFLFGIALARLLVPADFGVIATVQVFTGFVGMLATGGMGQSLIRAKEADENQFNAVFTLQLLLGMLIYAAFYAYAPWIAAYFGDPHYEDLLRVSALSFLLRPFHFIRISWLNREMLFRKRAFAEVTTGALTGLSSVMMAWAGMGVWSLVFAGLLGALVNNALLARLTPLRLALRFDLGATRSHSAYGAKITINDFIGSMIGQVVTLILSKLAGPTLLGLFNKAESLSRLPNRLIGPAVGQTIFPAMSKVQDDLDLTKYLFYRTVTLLLVYTAPLFVGLWWMAEPFIAFVYGEKWLPAAEPLRILALAGFFINLGRPCSAVLAAQNRLFQEMIAQVVMLCVVATACFIGVRWGLTGVAWAALVAHAIGAAYFYVLVYRTLPTGVRDLVRAVAPAAALNVPLFLLLALIDGAIAPMKAGSPLLYLLLMAGGGGLAYAAAFLFLPVGALRSEAARWRQQLGAVFATARRGLP